MVEALSVMDGKVRGNYNRGTMWFKLSENYAKLSRTEHQYIQYKW